MNEKLINVYDHDDGSKSFGAREILKIHIMCFI
jgi:hypothetical protein